MLRALLAGAGIALASASMALAASISPGNTINLIVNGPASVYAINGNPSGDGSPAVQIDFGAGAGNVFDFTATGTINCCGGSTPDPNWGPDGSPPNTSINSTLSYLSNAVGNSRIPLMGVFVDDDPTDNAQPADLPWDSSNPTSLSPLLNQVFYIGDGHAGFATIAGALLSFTAPSTATHLFLGVVDAFGFGGPSNAYQDNPGFFDVFVHLSIPAGCTDNCIDVPEPGTLGLLGAGLFGLWLRRRVKV